MEGSMRLSFRKGDWIAIAAVVLLCAAVAAFFAAKSASPEAGVIQIFQNSQLIRECSLQVDDTFTVEGTYCNVIEISDGKVAITGSNCPGEDCVHSGWIGQAGRSIVCLPNKVEIRITGSSDDVDIVVR